MKKGASLIELMVVIAIIAVLMAIMLPVYSKALGYASGGVCMSNLHQIHAALALYSNDHDGAKIGAGGAVYPPNLWHLRLPEPVTACKDRTPYVPLWFAFQELEDPILVVDKNRSAHTDRVIGVFASGRVQRRGGEGEPTDPSFWR